MDEQERCVYVKQAVLSQLERDKRGLKWQLARTAKIADTRAADVAACEAKVKDLLTIVEMNKSVADRAVKRAYNQEAALQRAVSERDDLQQRLLHQRQHFLTYGLRGLQQRAQWRLQRTTFHTLAAQTAWRRQVRVRIQRVAELRMRVRTAIALWQWRRAFHTTDAVSVHPLLLPPPLSPPTAASAIAAATAARTQAFATSSPSPTEFLFDERFRLRFKRRRERQRASFFAWKADWTLTKTQRRTARRWFETQLTRRTLRAWCARVRIAQQRRAVLELAARRRTQRIVRAWAAVSQRAAWWRTLLRRMLRSQRRTLLQQSFTRLRLRCMERSAVEWTLALQAAHAALEEEKVAYAMHQDTALRELHESYAAQEQRKRACLAQHSRQLTVLKQQQHLRQRFATWRAQATARRLRGCLAARVHDVQHCARVRRRHFAAWRHHTAAQTRVQRWLMSAVRTQQRTLLVRVLRAWHARALGECAKLRRLRALVSRVMHVQLLRSWSRWRQMIALDDQHVSAAYETRTLVQQMQWQQQSWQLDCARSSKLQRRLQLQCALQRRDAARSQLARRLIQGWAARARVCSQRRAALMRVLRRRIARIQQWSIARWRERAEQLTALQRTLDARAVNCDHRRLDAALACWRRFTRARVLLRWRGQCQRLYFALWRGALVQQRARAAALRRVLSTIVVRGWQMRIFRRWRHRSELIARSDQRRERQERDLCARIWRTWCAHVMRRLRCRYRQSTAIVAKTHAQQRTAMQRTVFRCWRLLTEHHRHRLRSIRCTGTRRLRPLQLRMLLAWCLWTRTLQQQRAWLTRVLRHTAMRATRAAWVRWVTLSVRTHATQTAQHRSIEYATAIAKRLVTHHALERAFVHWRTWLRTARHCRHARDRFAARHRTLLLAHCVRVWRHDFMHVHATLQQLLRRRVHLMQRAALARAFKRWEHVLALHTLSLQAAVSQILLDKAQERERTLAYAALVARSLSASFSAWRRLVASYSARRRVLRSAVVALTARRQRLAWRQWRACVSSHERLMRALQTIARLSHHSRLRAQWHAWRRRDQLASRMCAQQSEQQRALALVYTAIEALAHRRHRRSWQSRCFAVWRQQVAAHKRARALWHHTMRRSDAMARKTSFQRWRTCVALRHTRQTLLKRIVVRQVLAVTRTKLHHWRLQGLRAAHTVALERMRQELQRRRIDSAARVANALYMSWKRPCLVSCFASWRAHSHAARRALDTALEQFERRQCMRRTAHVLRAWRQCVYAKRSRSQRWQSAIAQYTRRLLADVLCVWRARVQRKWTLVSALKNFVDTLQKAHLRSGFRRLQQQQLDHRRRESSLLLMNAQHALAQQRHQLVLQRTALLLAHKQSAALQHVLARWRTATAASKQRKAFARAVQRRMAMHRLRRALRSWRAVGVHERVRRRLVRKLQFTAQQRWLRALWHHWREFQMHSQITKRLVFERLIAHQAQSAVQRAWRVWCSVVRQTRIAIEQERAATWAAAAHEQQCARKLLENHNEALLLERITLQKQVRGLRQRGTGAFCRVLATVVTSHCIARAFATWRRCADAVRSLQSLIASLQLRWRAAGFSVWRQAVDALRAQATRTQQQKLATDRVLRVFASSNTQGKKRSVLLRWQVLARTQRMKKRSALLLLLARRSTDRVVTRCFWASWRALVTHERTTRVMARALCTRREQRLQQRVLLCWHRAHLVTRHFRQRAQQVLTHVASSWRRRQLTKCWLRWTQLGTDTAVTLAHAQLVTLELEHWNVTCRHALDQLCSRVLANWKRVAHTARACRNARLAALSMLQRASLLRACLRAWHDQLPARQRMRRPVLCIQTSLHTQQRRGRVLYCSYREYRRKLQCRWRLTKTRAALRKRAVRTYALSLLLRAVRRQHMHSLRRAFWIWFAVVQSISPAIATISFRALPWRSPRANIAGSMLLVALEEMHHLQQAHSIEQRISSCQVLGCIVRGLQRCHLQRAFDRMAFAVSARHRGTKKTKTKVHRGEAVPFETRSHIDAAASVAAVRAGAQTLATVVARRAFRVWKQQYIAAALRCAETAQMELLLALRDVSSYRQTLDPYAVPY